MASEYEIFNIPGHVQLTSGREGIPSFVLSTPDAEAEISLLGGHMLRFDPKGDAPLLWMSPATPYSVGKAIRGGIPICFPWFGPHRTNKDLPVHGIARLKMWQPESSALLSDGRVRLVVALLSDETTMAAWPHPFRLELAVTVGKNLELELSATNTGREPFLYDDCLHTYFSVSDVAHTTVEGLDGVGYIDRLNGDVRRVQGGNLAPKGETVNAYMQCPARICFTDSGTGRRIVQEKMGFASTVVWNPWEGSARKNPEIATGWKDFLCVEAANCLDSPVTVLPGNTHCSAVRYSIDKA